MRHNLIFWGTAWMASNLGLLFVLSALGLSGPISFFILSLTMTAGTGISTPNITAAIVSIFPDLGGTASGLSGAMAIAAGAIVSALTGILLANSHTDTGLIGLMLGCASTSLMGISFIIRAKKHAVSDAV